MEALISCITAEGPAAKRPPHIRAPASSAEGLLEGFCRVMVPILTRFARLSAFVAIAFIGATAGAAEPPKFAGMAGDFSPIDPPEQIATPNFQDKLGQPVNLDSFKGKVVVLNFW